MMTKDILQYLNPNGIYVKSDVFYLPKIRAVNLLTGHLFSKQMSAQSTVALKYTEHITAERYDSR